MVTFEQRWLEQMAYYPASPRPRLRNTLALAASPAVIVFLSSNFVNVGNLVFNMIFSRLMGPELFGTLAILLTIKLALLGVTGAFQMAVSQMVASCTGDERPTVEQALSRINRFLFLGVLTLGTLLTTGLVLGGTVGARLSPTEPHLLAFLLAAIPFGASLSVLRGVAFGDIRTSRIVLSANAEMGVRLIGALLAWALGFGIEGVVVAISVSIIASWAVLYDLLPAIKPNGQTVSYSKAMGLATIPFAILQLTQVMALDGDIFIAKSLLSEQETGFVAALSLFQRIQFFACFALAGVLLPRVILAARTGEDVVQSAMPVFLLFAGVSLVVLSATLLAPETLVVILVGDAYIPAATALLAAVSAAMFFTFNYLVTTFLVALKDRNGVVMIAAGACIQFGAMAASESAGFADLIFIKAICQAGTAFGLALCAISHLRRTSRASCL